MPLLQGLNPEAKPTMGGVQLLEPGVHKVKIVGTEIQATYDNTGQQVVVYFEAPGGEAPRHWFTFAGGAEPWQRKKGQEQLALLCECVGVDFMSLEVKGTEVLHGRNVMVNIKHKPSKQLRDDGTPFVNMEITNFMPVSETAVPEKPKAASPW
jgi:hypothetical protein